MARDRASRPEARPLRLFVAVDIPPEVRDVVAAGIAPWRDLHPGGRWVPAANWHVTLKFLGRTWPRLLDWVTEVVGECARGGEPFESRVEGLGAFPSSRRARVLWAGLRDPEGRLAAIAGALDVGLAREFRPEGRAFMPHLTVARFEPPARIEGVDESDVRSEPFVIDRLVLYRSHLQRPAPVYEPLREFRLR